VIFPDHTGGWWHRNAGKSTIDGTPPHSAVWRVRVRGTEGKPHHQRPQTAYTPVQVTKTGAKVRVKLGGTRAKRQCNAWRVSQRDWCFSTGLTPDSDFDPSRLQGFREHVRVESQCFHFSFQDNSQNSEHGDTCQWKPEETCRVACVTVTWLADVKFEDDLQAPRG
jgi:hypothetical protein